MTADQRPILAITMGDPAGIGPEIAVKARKGPAAAEVYRDCWPLVVGDAGVMKNALAFMNSSLTLNVVETPANATGTPGVMDVLDLHNVDPAKLQLGKVSAEAGEAAFQAITRSIELAMADQIDGVVTNPIHKEALHLAGHKFPGHTEIFAHYSRSKESVMMLAEGHFRVGARVDACFAEGSGGPMHEGAACSRA